MEAKECQWVSIAPRVPANRSHRLQIPESSLSTRTVLLAAPTKLLFPHSLVRDRERRGQSVHTLYADFQDTDRSIFPGNGPKL